MRYLILFLFFLANINLANSQNRKTNVSELFNSISLKPGCIYLFCRGTLRKANLISKKYNINDTNITHIGIGYLENNRTNIYNVSDVFETNQGALLIDSINSFISVDGAYYLSIWQCNNSNSEFEKLKGICKNYKSKRIVFDAHFTISNDDTLYCSEFCVDVLRKLNAKKFKFVPSYKKINNLLYEAILKRKSLSYYPVDFFEVNRNFKKIYEFSF